MTDTAMVKRNRTRQVWRYQSAVSVITRSMVYDYPFGIFKLALSCFFWPLRCLSLHDLWFMIIPLVSSNLPCPVSFDHCSVCHYTIYCLWLPLWYLQTCLVLFLLTIAVSVNTRFMVYDYPFDIFKLALSCFVGHCTGQGKFEDTKGVIINNRSCNDRHCNGQKKQDKASLKIPKG
jgi:hypothetical protein